MLGDTAAHRRFWNLLDYLSRVFWNVSRHGAKLPLRSISDVLNAIRVLGIADLPAARFLRWTLGDALKYFRLRDDRPLVGLLAMLVEDTVNSTIDNAPLINAALGVTIRGAGLTRAKGGMRGFWQEFVRHYKRLGGDLRVGCSVHSVAGRIGHYELQTQRGVVEARQLVSAVPASLSARIAAPVVKGKLDSYLERDAKSFGGALVAFLGVPEEEVSVHSFTHHQLLQDYEMPLGNGNNMFISVSAEHDTESAPPGYRAVMISTHCELDDWTTLRAAEYEQRKAHVGKHLVELARRVYPRLGERATVFEVATPRTFQRFTHRPEGAVGGVRQSLQNSNQRAIPHDVGVPGFFLAGDTTWPGLGTVACVLGSRVVANLVIQQCGMMTDGFNSNDYIGSNTTALVN
jgi:phytoene dehydrogenase-like protein